MTTDDELKARVDRGVAWLDSRYPDWRDHVEILDFDITNRCNCVLGQLFADQANSHQEKVYWSEFGGFDWAIYMENLLSPKECISLGFDISMKENSMPHDYNRLQNLWEKVLAG